MYTHRRVAGQCICCACPAPSRPASSLRVPHCVTGRQERISFYSFPYIHEASSIRVFFFSCSGCIGMGDFVASGGNYVQSLALCSVQLFGLDATSVRPTGAPLVPSLAAGLPHFSTGCFRAWYVFNRRWYVVVKNYSRLGVEILASLSEACFC
jgi:hypothetical protein